MINILVIPIVSSTFMTIISFYFAFFMRHKDPIKMTMGDMLDFYFIGIVSAVMAIIAFKIGETLAAKVAIVGEGFVTLAHMTYLATAVISCSASFHILISTIRILVKLIEFEGCKAKKHSTKKEIKHL